MNTTQVAPIAQESLIPVFSGEIAGIPAQLVDARALHEFLESKQHFSIWFKKRIADYGFTQDIDFSAQQKNVAIESSTYGQDKIDYHLSLDMAKELGMVERNEKGRQIRRYFIEIERAALAKHQYGLKDLASPHITEAEATRFKKSIEQHCKSNSKNYPVLYRKIYDYYKITTYKHIPAGKLAEAAQLCGMVLVELSKPRMPKEQQVVTLTQAQLDALVNERVALALPAPSSEFPPEVLSAIERRAHTLSLRHYDKIKEQLRAAIQKWGKDLAGQKLVEFIQSIDLPDSQLVVVHCNTLWRLTNRLQKTLDALHTLEQETGMEWYGRD